MKKKRSLSASRDPEHNKETSMSWFERWLSKKMQTAWNQTREETIYAEPKQRNTGLFIGSANKVARSSDLDMRPTMNFKMHHAENGWVIEVHGYDQRTDNTWSKLHLISDTEEFDKALAQIMTVEALRN
jgi:hypothetical protein